MLTVEDVARVLGRTGAGATSRRASGSRNGVIVPGLRKIGGQWLVPIAALADALDNLVDFDSLGRPSPKRSPTRHMVISANPVVDRPRRGRIPNCLKAKQARALAFWPAVLARFDAERLDGVWPRTVPDVHEPGRL